MGTQTTKHLAAEHRRISLYLKAFRRYLADFSESESPDSRESMGLLDYLTESLFLRHEEKEEGVLLPEIARLGVSWSDGVLAEVRQEHRQGRYLTRALLQALRQTKQWSGDDRAHFTSVAETWCTFVRDHMRREERTLFPFIDSRIEDDLDRIIVTQFERTDAEYNEMADFALLQAGGDAFLSRYGSRTQGT